MVGGAQHANQADKKTHLVFWNLANLLSVFLRLIGRPLNA
ncbi:hypothetical protein Cabys_945 [Caldithrix abyssi DSM 13497]|uniref:Uncharacterized protein n=1 Tax=Caldithrix abyssi DSM 13497 TaxID=880073 RepID=A0A1J1C713_CALAY|nr:hypothetical protein Cabys_945 [Caldithrix abyssi DSM 13497]